MSALIAADDLRYRYPTGFQAGPLTFSSGPGVVHLTGPNGSGKTTLLRCLCGALRGFSGSVRIRGVDPREVAARRDVALLSAEPELPEFLTVDEAWQQLAAIRGVPDWAGGTLRDRLDLPPGLRVGHASAGQRRLIELLVAAAGDPAVLLLDEPFANLDPDRAHRVRTLLEAWRATRAIVITSHLPLPLQPDQVAVTRAAGADPA